MVIALLVYGSDICEWAVTAGIFVQVNGITKPHSFFHLNLLHDCQIAYVLHPHNNHVILHHTYIHTLTHTHTQLNRRKEQMKRALEQQQRELAEKRKQFDDDKRLFDQEHQRYMEELEASMR